MLDHHQQRPHPRSYYQAMQVCCFVEPQQGATFDEVLRCAEIAQQVGFHGFFTSDHYLPVGQGSTTHAPLDAWTTLAGLAGKTTEIQLGTLVSPVTFRRTGSLAVQAAQVSRMSGGRVEIGLGSGWNEAEHAAFGLPFPSQTSRFEDLEQCIRELKRTWSSPLFAEMQAPTTQSNSQPDFAPLGMPIIVGGTGSRVTPNLAVRFATEYNTSFTSCENFSRLRKGALQLCEEHGRDPQSLKVSAVLTVACGDSSSEVGRRLRQAPMDQSLVEANGATGLPTAVLSTLREYHDAGADRVYLRFWDLADLDHVGLVGRAVESSASW